MREKKKVLTEWLETEEWRFVIGPDIPHSVLEALKSFLASEHADIEELELYSVALFTIFNFYQKPAYVHSELLAAVLIKIGICSKQKFWLPAVRFLNMAPHLGNEAIRMWVKALNLSDKEEREFRTELFHAYR